MRVRFVKPDKRYGGWWTLGSDNNEENRSLKP